MDKLTQLINACTEYYIEVAKSEYANVSSFAIITTEDFAPFDFAVNTNGFFEDMQNKKISDEDYWNTAEWVEEMLSAKYPNPKIEELNELLSDNLEKPHFLAICKQALKNIRKNTDSKVCLFVHCTDFATSEELHNIVAELNTDDIYQSYKEYYAEIG